MAKNERKKTIWPAGTVPAAFISDDMATKTVTDVILSAMAVSAPPALEIATEVTLYAAPRIAVHMRAGVAGISI